MSHATMSTDRAVDMVCDWLDGDGCVLFLGAAFSARKEGDVEGGGVPGTRELLKSLPPPPASPEETLSSALEAKFGHPPKGKLQSFLREQFQGSKPKRGHHLAARLPFRTVITTNCDDLMERACRNIWKDVATVVFDEDLCRAGSADVTVVKPHGCVNEDEAALVFTTSQYAIFPYGRPMLTRWLTATLATHHTLYLGYGLNDDNVLGTIVPGLNSSPLRRKVDVGPPISLAVLGEGQRPDFGRFEEITKIEPVECDAEEFIKKVYDRHFARKRAEDHSRIELIQETLESAPERFMQNCCLATLRDTFPVSLIQWNLSMQEVRDAKTRFMNFFAAGLVEPVMKMGDQWYRLCTDLRTKCETRLSQGGRKSALADYYRFLQSELERLDPTQETKRRAH
jgi:hypothetical protein